MAARMDEQVSNLATALAPCAAVMESIVEDAQAKSACYRDIEAVVGADVLLWSSTSNFPMTRLAAEMAHPERAIVVPFDPTHGRQASLSYLTIAVGRDYLDVAPTSGTFNASYRGQLSAKKRVDVTSLEYETTSMA